MRVHNSGAYLGCLLAVVLGCSPSTMPVEEPTETYVLLEVEGEPLPTVLYTNENYAFTVFADTIRLNADRTGTISSLISGEPVNPLLLPFPPTLGTADIRYHLLGLGDRLAIEYVCPPNADCAAPPHLLATRQGMRLVVTPGPQMVIRSPLVYTLAE